MANDRPAQSKSEAALQRKFADVAAQLRRADIIAHLLAILLFVGSYAFAYGLFEECVGTSAATWITLTRWAAFAVFLTVLIAMSGLLIRCSMRTINPYFIAQHLERTLPDAKNGLINWLDLHDDDLPSAFQKHLGSRASEQWEDADVGIVASSPRNKILLALLAIPAIGLGVLLVLNARALGPTMSRAFMPFVAPAPTAKTRITLLDPSTGDAETSGDRDIAFAVRIEGRVPGQRRADSPMLHLRHDPTDELTSLVLQPQADGAWTLTIPASNIRGGFTYHITAGDAATPLHQIRVRSRAFVTRFIVNYEPRAYSRAAKSTVTFPNEQEPRLAVRGLRGTDVELTCETSRPVKSTAVIFLGAKMKQHLETRIAPSGSSFLAKWTLDQSGKLRIAFTTNDGEENTDRTEYEIDVRADE